MRTLIVKKGICKECKKEFQVLRKKKGKNVNFCSKSCQMKYYRRVYREKFNSSVSNSRKKNIDYYREYLNNYQAKKREEYKNKLFVLLGNKCSNPNCPIPQEKLDKRCLQVDHINGQGTSLRKRMGRQVVFYRNILKEIKSGSKDYQLLCVYCNWLKSYINKERKLRCVVS